MKKLVVILLMVVYGASSLGATVHLHYCMNKLVEWGAKDCSKFDEEKMVSGKGKCCNDIFQRVKIENHYKNAIPIISINKLLIDVTSATNIEYLSISFFNIPTNSFAKQQDQRSNKTKIYILNCVYRI